MPTFIGKTVTVNAINQLQVGDKAYDFKLMATDLTYKTLSDFAGKKNHFHCSINRYRYLFKTDQNIQYRTFQYGRYCRTNCFS